jgi:hypothetical protein
LQNISKLIATLSSHLYKKKQLYQWHVYDMHFQKISQICPTVIDIIHGGRGQNTKVKVHIWLSVNTIFISRKKICQETRRACLYAQQPFINTWIHLGMMLMICSTKRMWGSVLLMGKTGVPGENHRSLAIKSLTNLIT